MAEWLNAILAEVSIPGRVGHMLKYVIKDGFPDPRATGEAKLSLKTAILKWVSSLRYLRGVQTDLL